MQTRTHSAPRKYSTDEAAAQFLVKPDTLRAAVCRQGHYFGIRPVKAPNRLLHWPADEVDRIAAGEVA